MKTARSQLKIKNELCHKPILLNGEEIGFIRDGFTGLGKNTRRVWFVYRGTKEQPVELAGNFAYYQDAVKWVKACNINEFSGLRTL